MVVGASSTVGQLLTERLRADGHVVRTASRSDAEHPVDVTRPESFQGVLNGVSTVYSLVGASLAPTWLRPEQTFDAIDRQGNLNLIDACEAAGVERFIYLSVFGPETSSLSYIEAHRAVDHRLAGSLLSTTSVRPTGFFESLDVLRQLGSLGVGSVLKGGRARTNPIHEADLADVLAAVVASGPDVLPCGGPETLTRRTINEVLAARPTVQVPVPSRVMRASGRMLGVVNPRLGDLVAFLSWALAHDCVAPAYGTRRLSES